MIQLKEFSGKLSNIFNNHSPPTRWYYLVGDFKHKTKLHMAFVNDYLPLPTKPLINSTFTYKTNVLTNSELKEQRIPINSEYRLQVDLSDVTFTETELQTFITFYQTNLKGKLNTFRLRHPFENTTTLDPFQLDVAGEMFSYGRAIYIGTDPDTVGNHLFRVFKVYEYRNGTDVYRAFKTIQAIDDSEPIDIRRDDDLLPIGSGFSVIGGTGVISVNSSFFTPNGTAAGEVIKVACTYDHVMRLDVDAIPQITLALRPINQTTGCDKYQFESLPLIEEINERVNPYVAIAPSTAVPITTTGDNLILGSGFTNQIFQTIIPREFDLPLRPMETIEYKFDTKVVSVNDFEYRDSYSNEDNRWRGVFDSTRVRQERAQEIAAFFFIAKGRLHRFTVNFRNVPTQTGRFDQDSITFDHLVAASEANYHLFATNTTQKSLYDLQSLEFIAAVGVDPIDLSSNNDIADTTGEATYVLTFTDIDTSTNFEGAFYTDLKYLSVEQSSLTTLDVPLFTVAQNVSGTIELTEGGYGTDPIVQRVQKTTINGRLGIDSNDLVGAATNKTHLILATDGDVEVYLKSNLTTPIMSETAANLYDLDGDPDLVNDARITNVRTSGRGELIVSMIAIDVNNEVAAAGVNTTDLNFFGIGKQNTTSTLASFTQLEITQNQSVFFDPGEERIRYSENNDAGGINLALTPTGAGDLAIAHDVIDFNLQSNYTAVIAGGAAPEAGLTMAEIFPIAVLVNTRGISQSVLNAVSLPNFNHTRRLLNINNLYFPQDGEVLTTFNTANNFLDYETLISPDSPLQDGDMTTREFYGGTIGGNGAAYTWRAGNSTPTAPYAIGSDFELTQINADIRLIPIIENPYQIPPETIVVNSITIDPDNLTAGQLTDAGGYYSGNLLGGREGTGSNWSQAGNAINLVGYSASVTMDQLPPDYDTSAVFFSLATILSAPTTGVMKVLAITSNTSSIYHRRIIVYDLELVGTTWEMNYNAADTAQTRQYTQVLASGNRPRTFRHSTKTAYYYTGNNNTFGNPQSTTRDSLISIELDDAGNISTTYTNDSEITGVTAMPFFSADDRIYYATTAASNALLVTKNGIEHRDGRPLSNSGRPFGVSVDNVYNSGVVNYWAEDTADGNGRLQRRIQFADQSIPVEVTQYTPQTGITFGAVGNLYGEDGSAMHFIQITDVCESPNTSSCDSTPLSLQFQLLRPDINVSPVTAQPILNSVWEDVAFTASQTTNFSAYAYTSLLNLTGTPRCDRFGNVVAKTSNNAYYGHSKSGLMVSANPVFPGGTATSYISPSVTTWGFAFLAENTSNPLTGGLTLVFVQPQVII